MTETNNLPISASQVIIRNKETFKKIGLQIGFSLIEKSNGLLKRLKSSYNPAYLKENQFIYTTKKKQKSDSELARFETKKDVLDKPHALNKWFQNILNAKTL